MSSGRLYGKLITEHMKRTGDTYGALAARIGISTSLLRQLEEGYYPRRNGSEIVAAVAKELGCSVGALVIPVGATKAG